MPKCKRPEAGFIHLYWKCTVIEQFWEQVICLTERSFKIKISETPFIWLLGNGEQIQAPPSPKELILKLYCFASGKT